MAATTYGTALIAKALFSQTTGILSLANLFFGLTTSDPTVSGALTGEPTATGSYARVSMTNNTTNFPVANPVLNGTAITFATSSAAWSTGATNLAFWFVTDSATLGAGNMLMSGALTTGRSVNASGVTLSFAASALSITVA